LQACADDRRIMRSENVLIFAKSVAICLSITVLVTMIAFTIAGVIAGEDVDQGGDRGRQVIFVVATIAGGLTLGLIRAIRFWRRKKKEAQEN
jgi:hypothetical protein